MSGDLEDFVKRNRGAFDDRDPSEEGWPNVRNAIFSKERPAGLWHNVAVWRAAAIILMVTTLSMLVPSKLFTATTAQADMKEFSDVESFYVRQISQKVELLEQISRGDDSESMTQEFNNLEAMYQVLREELKKRPSKEVKDALVLNLLVRINLLNQQIDDLENGYQDKKSDGPEKSI